jgi:serine/threonine-protein kinase RIM15
VISAEDIVAAIKDPTDLECGLTRETTIAEEPAAELDASGKLTPPTIFPQDPGDHSEIIDMDAALVPSLAADPNATPRPQQQLSTDPDPTPRASTSPQHQD